MTSRTIPAGTRRTRPPIEPASLSAGMTRVVFMARIIWSLSRWSARRDHRRARAAELRKIDRARGLPVDRDAVLPREGAVGIGGIQRAGQRAASRAPAPARAALAGRGAA